MAELQREYQILLELHRADPDDEHTWRLLAQTEAQLFAAWARNG